MYLQLANVLKLTEVRRTDRDSLVEYLNDRVMYECSLRIPYPYTLSDAEKWLDLVESASGQDDFPVWAIRNESDTLIGAVGLEGRRPTHRAEIGYWLARPFWGRGIMTSAVKAVTQHAFEQLGLSKITAHVFSFNARSARVLEKCGFEQEGYLKKHFQKDAQCIDAMLYALFG